MTEVPLLYEVGGGERFDEVVVITAPPKLARARAAGRAATTARRGCSPTGRRSQRADFAYVNTGTLEELDASWLGGVRSRADRQRVKRLVALVVLARVVAVAAALAAYVARRRARRGTSALRYPLATSAIVRGHARNYDLDPALLAAVIYRRASSTPTRARAPARSG